MKTNEELLEEIYSHFLPAEPEKDEEETEEEETVPVDPEEIMNNLIVDCIETGIGYWNSEWPAADGESDCYSERVWEAVKRGETLTFGDKDESGDLNLDSVLKALDTLKKHDPDTYECIVEENWDAYTADIFFQVAVFGEVVFR